METATAEPPRQESTTRPSSWTTQLWCVLSFGYVHSVSLGAASSARRKSSRTRSWTADALCRPDADCAPMGGARSTNSAGQPAETQQHNQPGRRSDELDADVVSFQPRFPLQELIFAHCPVPALPSHSWEFSHQIRLALSQGNRRHRVRHLADPDHGQLLIARWWPLNPSHDVQITSCLSATLTLTSSNTALISFTLAVLVQETVATVLLCRKPAKPWRLTHKSEPFLSRQPLVAQHERTRHHPRGNGRTSRHRRLATTRWLGPHPYYQLSPTQPIVLRSAIRVKSSPP